MPILYKEGLFSFLLYYSSRLFGDFSIDSSRFSSYFLYDLVGDRGDAKLLPLMVGISSDSKSNDFIALYCFFEELLANVLNTSSVSLVLFTPF